TMAEMSEKKVDIFEKPSVERLVAGSTYIVAFSVLGGLLGWIYGAIASRADIGVGNLYGYLVTVYAFNAIGLCIISGFNQALSKFISEALVESKEKAIAYANAGFIIFNVIGIILFAIFMTVAVWFFSIDLYYSIIFIITAFAYLLMFFQSNLGGNLAAVHRFDYIAKKNFFGTIVGIIVGFSILFFVPGDIRSVLLPLSMIVTTVSQIIILIYYMKKAVPYSISAIFKIARREELARIFKYGLYCIVPALISSGAIFYIQTLWYSGFFGPGSLIVSANGIIIGYSTVALAIVQIGIPQIPAVAEAKAMNDYKLVDKYMKTTMHNGFNMSIFLLTIYIGISYQILYLFHGDQYTIAQIPFILLSSGLIILGIEYLICSFFIGLGEGKKAALLIIALTIIQITLIPLLIRWFQSISMETTLYAGPLCLLISATATFPVVFYFLTKFTHYPKRVYLSILGKGTASLLLTFLCYGLLEWFVFPNSSMPMDMIIGLFVRVAILFGFFVFFMLFFNGLNDADLDLYKKMLPWPLRLLIPPMRAFMHHSPFYRKKE
ncbi:MAG TPA: hypothetical protein VMV49_07990, partial [Candidatus Deferrimicrobium sp.]|nr:hypothetical protein [Candidatus Deferrimicrobium sp.]